MYYYNTNYEAFVQNLLQWRELRGKLLLEWAYLQTQVIGSLDVTSNALQYHLISEKNNRCNVEEYHIPIELVRIYMQFLYIHYTIRKKTSLLHSSSASVLILKVCHKIRYSHLKYPFLQGFRMSQRIVPILLQILSKK